MAVIIAAEHIAKRYTLKRLIDDATLYIDEHDRIGVVGINGTGKSTLLKLLAGLEEPDSGVITRRSGLRVAYLPQMPQYTQARTAEEQVLADATVDGQAPDAYQARALLMQLGIADAQADVRTLSGGQKKRVALAAALIRPVDLLLLDEPTNHIDAQTIAWLEERLAKYRGALMMVTHDRYFLDRVCSRIVELSEGGVYAHDGGFQTYLQRKAERLEQESAQARKRSAILRRELAWIQRGAQARSTKQKARIERFEALSAMQAKPQAQQQLTLGSASARLGRRIIECEGVAKAMGGRTLFTDFTYTILRDERMAVVGPNGCGKTTLLRLLAGELTPDAGSVVRGDTVRIGYFAQEFPPVRPDQRLIDLMRDVAEYVQTPDGRVSASQMLERFLFPADVQYTPVERLSGGERRRLHLALVLMGSPNVLLLDEPTNDLDIATLEILEDYLDSFAGAVVAVSHDRYFLDRIAKRLFAFESGVIRSYICSMSDYLDALAAQQPKATASAFSAKGDSATRREHTRALRMSYKEEKEYATIDARIAELNDKLENIDAQIAASATDFVRLTELAAEREQTEQALAQAEERWLYLTDLAERIAAQQAGGEP